MIADIFHRLHIIEKFGTGIDRIRDAYDSFPSKPGFEITTDFIRVVLPVIDYDSKLQEPTLSERILRLLSEEDALSRSEIEGHTGFKRTKVLKELEQLIGDGMVEITGGGQSTKYRIK